MQGTRLDFNVGGKDITNLQKLSLQPIPMRGVFSASGKIHDLGPKRYGITDLTLGLGENDISGTADLEWIEPIPRLSATLSSKKLDLSPHLISGMPRFIEKGNLTNVGPFELSVKLAGPIERIIVENIDLRFGSQTRLAARLNGTINDIKKLSGLQLEFKLEGNNVSYLESFTESPLPVKGAFALGAHILYLLNPFKKKAARTTVNCFTNSIRIKEGLADCKLLLDTEQISIFGAGKIDLKSEKLNIGIKPNPKKGYGHSKVAKISVNLRRLSKTLKLGGTLANPSLTINKTGTTILAGKFAGGLFFGPLGLAAVAASEFTNFSIGAKNPCLTAIEEAADTLTVPADK